MRKQAGFTLIELVVVLVLLGILGAVATAQFQDLGTEAAEAVEDAVAGELSSGAAINYAMSVTNPTAAAATISGTVDCTGAEVQSLLQQGTPPEITLADGGDVTCDDAGDTVECSIEHDSGDGTPVTTTLLCTGS